MSNPGYSAANSEQVKQATAKLRNLLRQVKTVPTKVLEVEARRIQREAKIETPYKTGKLEGSVKCRVSHTLKGVGLNVSASARGKDFNYAGIQHDVPFNHPIKGKEKYLLDPFNRGVDRIVRKLKIDLMRYK